MISVLDKYLLTSFIRKFIGISFSFLVVFIVVDIIDHLDKFIDSRMPLYEVSRYYILTLPWFICMGTPMAMLLSSVLTFSSLQKYHELTAIKASGLSVYRISVPMLIVGLIVSISIFLFDNKFVSNSLQERQEIEDEYFPSNNQKSIKRNVLIQMDKDIILSMNRFDHRTNTAHDVSLQYFDSSELVQRVDIPTLIWSDGIWNASDYYIRHFASGSVYVYTHGTDSIFNFDIEPMTIIQKTVKPQEMNYWDLKKFVDKIEDNGIRDPRWAVNLNFKTAFAFSSFLMVLFGSSISIRRPRSNVAIGIGSSVLVIFLYYLVIKLGQTLGYSGVVSPFLSVWSANLVFLIVGVLLLYRTRT